MTLSTDGSKISQVDATYVITDGSCTRGHSPPVVE
jgi:hypothetical protein